MVGRKGVEDHKKTLRGGVKFELDVPRLNTLSKMQEEDLNWEEVRSYFHKINEHYFQKDVRPEAEVHTLRKYEMDYNLRKWVKFTQEYGSSSKLMKLDEGNTVDQ